MKLAVIGIGLIGGSAALAMKRSGLITSVSACDLSPEAVKTAVELGIADEGYTDAAAAARTADVVMVATPVLAMESIFRQVRPALKEDAVITDVGSVRGVVQEAAHRALGEKIAQYAPCHPIAGGDKSGVQYSFPDMFVGKRVISTSGADTAPWAAERMEKLWQSCGAEILRMTPERHDEVFALMSHLPHVLAYAMVAMLLESRDPATLLSMGGTGFQDFSRIAASSPVMWRDICLANRQAISKGLRAYRKELDWFQKVIDDGNADLMVACFARAAEARRSLGHGTKLREKEKKSS